ncbi:unnamed protein product [Linum trigynum]|uniref:Uncharacterized protein n=1 Tax=Linum trigynum TaxID=586398 RepID=A0AAV2DCR4_9ROSI
MGFKEGCFPVHYLGLPIFDGKLNSKECEILVDKITSRVCSWRANKVSFAGRLQLVSSVIYSDMQLWMSIFISPRKVLDNIHKICSNFLWHGDGSGSAKVSWDILANSKKEGELGLKDLSTWNVECFARLLWLIFMLGGSFSVA